MNTPAAAFDMAASHAIAVGTKTPARPTPPLQHGHCPTVANPAADVKHHLLCGRLQDRSAQLVDADVPGVDGGQAPSRRPPGSFNTQAPAWWCEQTRVVR